MKKLSKINESGIISQLNRHLAGEIDRKCNIELVMDGVDNSHSFKDMNGNYHKLGYIVTVEDEEARNEKFKELIDVLLEIRGLDCDLNDVDTSNISDFGYLFKKTGFKGDVSGWNTESLKSLFFTFGECSEFDCDLSKWNTSNVANFNGTFISCSKFTGKGIEKWNVSESDYFTGMFAGCKSLDKDFSFWKDMFVKEDISFVSMFEECKNITGKGFDSWNVRNVNYVEKMFMKCENLDVDLSSWNNASFKNVKDMFLETKMEKENRLPEWYLDKINESGIISQLNRHLSGNIERKCNIVNISGVDNQYSFTDKNGTFHKNGYHIIDDSVDNLVTLAKLIDELISIRGNDCDLNDIDVSNVEDMSSLFFDHPDFCGDVSGWDTSNVKIFFRTFFGCPDFDCDLSKWDTSSAESMSYMFSVCQKFKGTGLKNWKVPKAYDFSCMFYNCPLFNENISSWSKTLPKEVDKEGHGINMEKMFYKCKSFDKKPSSWKTAEIESVKEMFTETKLEKELNLPLWYKKKIK